MGPIQPQSGTDDGVHVFVPRHSPPAGMAMAGFRARGGVDELRVIPYPAVTLFFDLGAAPLQVEEGTRRYSGSVALGLAPRSLRGHGSDVECLQVRLSPILARAAGLPDDFGAATTLPDAWGRHALDLEARLRRASSWQERFTLAAEAIAARARASAAPSEEVGEVWRRLFAAHGSPRVEALAADVGWSRKRLWSRFRAQTGLTPKGAARLIRFDHAAHALAAGRSPAVVAAESGYADQSHLAREVADFTGSTPAAIAGAPWLDVDEIAWRDPGYARP